MNTLADYFAMGGYAAYVWPAYAIAAGVLGGMTAYSWHRYRQARDAVERLPPATRPR